MNQILSHFCTLMIIMVQVTLCRVGVLSVKYSSWTDSDTLPTNNLESRRKRSDCTFYGQTGKWKFNCECSNTQCTAESARQAFTSVCSVGQPCYLSNKDSASWSSSYQSNTFLSAHCSPDINCGDGMGDYTCTCLGGYVESDCDLKVILPATIVPVVGICLILVAGFLAYRWCKRRHQNKVSPSESPSVNQTAASMPSNSVYRNKTREQVMNSSQ